MESMDGATASCPNVSNASGRSSCNSTRVPNCWSNFKAAWRDNHAWPVFYSATVANILALNCGIALGFASPAIPNLQTDDKVTSINDSSVVFSAMVPFGATLSGPLIGYFLDALGRHMTLMLCAVPYTIGWLLIMITPAVTGHGFLPVLYMGRFFTGVGLGFSISCVPCYIAELSPSALRGFFVGSLGIYVAVGILLIQLCGIIPGATYYWLPVVPLITVVIFVLLMAFTTVETPRWLQKRNQARNARHVLLWLRGKNYDVDKELQEIAEQISKEKTHNFFQKFKHRSGYLPLILGCCLTSFPQISGNAAVVFYSEVIFSEVKGIGNNAGIVSALCVGGGQVVGAILLLLLVDKFGRRKLLTWGGVTMCLSAAAMGIYYIFNSDPYCNPDAEQNSCVETITPVAIISITIFCASFTAAWAGLPYLVATELLPLQIRGSGIGIVAFFGWSSATVLLLTYEPCQKGVTLWAPFFMFSFIMFCAVLFVLKLIPETKGKTLEEIEEDFLRNKEEIDSVTTELTSKPLYDTMTNSSAL